MKPRLTVVVPVHRIEGSERDAEECLESVAAQTLTELDVVLVDAGSWAGSEEEAEEAGAGDGVPGGLARRFAERDPRFRIVRHGGDSYPDGSHSDGSYPGGSDSGGRRSGGLHSGGRHSGGSRSRGSHPGGPSHEAAAPGVGAVRNAGVRHAYPRTDYLAFLDPDDVLLPRAYEDLTGLLDKSGADFATGNVYRLGPGGRRQSPYHPADRETTLRTHITQDLTLLSDHFARNKVFRRAFWERHQLAFPEGGLCDAAVTLPAHFLAEAVDVLHEHVCYWRLPEGPGRHRRIDVRSVRDRFATIAGVRRFLADPARPPWSAYLDDYDRSVLTDGLPELIEALPEATPECRTVFLECARGFLAQVDPRLFPALPVELRMRWYLVRAGRLADLLALLAHEARNPAGFEVTGPPLRKRAVLPLSPPLELPPGVTRLERSDFPVTARVREAVWRDGALLLRGYAYIRNLDAATRHSYLRTAVVAQGRRRILLPLRPVAMPEATAESGQEQHCYDWSGFEVTLDPGRLRRGGRWVEGDWTVGVLLASAGVVRAAALCASESGSGAFPSTYEVGGDGEGDGDGTDGRGDGDEVTDGGHAPVRITPWYANGRLRLSVGRRTRRLAGHRSVAGGVLELTVMAPGPAATPEALPTGTAPGQVPDVLPTMTTSGQAPEALPTATAPGPAPVALRLTHQGTGGVVSVPVERREVVRDAGHLRVTVRVRLDALVAARPTRDGAPRAIPPVHTESWAAELVLPDGGTDVLACAPGLAPVAYPLSHGRELVVAASAAGNVVLHDRTPQPFLDRVIWGADGTLLVVGTLPDAAPHATELVLKHTAHAAETAFAVMQDGSRFHCALPLGGLPSLAGSVPLREGRWTLHLRERGAAGSPLDAPVRFAPAVFDGLPAACTVRGKPLVLDRHRYDEAFVAAGPAVPVTDRGPYRRRMLRERHYPLHRGRPLRDAVLYSSFGGRAYGDSPRAVHEELVRRGPDVEHLWAVRDAQAAVPRTARAVVVGSAEWHGALAHSRWVVTNTHLPDWFTRREGQTVVQTWHGTPLKRIGADLAGTLCAGLAHLAPRPRLGRQWSVLLSPNAHSTPVLRSALGYDGDLLETGLPRTDALFTADRERTTAALRARLGIPYGKKIVLYAPTPRDDRAYDAGHHRLHLPLDLDAARRALADDHVLLVRGHPLVVDRLPAHHAPFALDVTAHPDAAELLLAADVLVTDYSSLAADFANTGRPMLFLTPDLPHYRDTLRGFTLDFEARVPGPLLASTGELVDALGDLEAIAAAGADAYADFRETFCHRDDGGAAARVADLLTE
ncbi:CDP-glycerol glycerophosphotransferase family protein [Streptomyces halobius]|uniref:CDP-glycerol glycerophosphotransferase family protein n=1 Tax=Streptomyces halobius TaxID=2879846 RepID=A0ABY4MFL5_9ACTN|nr:CDP-glycerol glycerophosphotransferase family protein [Streptomyces halobius]UQA95141.1 CDP-glycerol glycerophosphotransferase family protein [Streptomyces halobius]